MKKNILVSVVFMIASASVLFAQQPKPTGDKYGRSSIYPVLIPHPQTKFSSQIDYVYLSLPTPDKYENHSLKVRRVEGFGEKWVDEKIITEFLEKNNVARRMVEKWFNRDENGIFNVDLVAERGNYNATVLDVEEARMSTRGLAMLADAGEELIDKTFVMVSDIVYVDKEKQAQTAATVLRIFGEIASAAAAAAASDGNDDAATVASGVSALAGLGALVASNLEGFTVKVKTHLYQLQWNEEVADEFYTRYWVDKNTPEAERMNRKEMFDKSGLFHLKYLGSYVDKSEQTVFKGLYSKEDVIKKVCARAIDRSIVGLQQAYDVFKVKTPITNVEGSTVQAQIGMKEGVSEKTKFEVLQRVEKENGRTAYRRIATLKPQKKQIWDNRFMAYEEQAEGSNLNATTFSVVGAANILPGMLIRQIK